MHTTSVDTAATDPLDAVERPAAADATWKETDYSLYLPTTPVVGTPLKIALLYAVGPELNRRGLTLGHFPSSIRMMPEKSFAAWPLLTNMLKSWAALAPSGVLALTALAACWASSRSFSIIAAVKPAW